MDLALSIVNIVLSISIGFGLGRIYTFRHEVKEAHEQTRASLEGWDKTMELLKKTSQLLGAVTETIEKHVSVKSPIQHKDLQ